MMKSDQEATKSDLNAMTIDEVIVYLDTIESANSYRWRRYSVLLKYDEQSYRENGLIEILRDMSYYSADSDFATQLRIIANSIEGRTAI